MEKKAPDPPVNVLLIAPPSDLDFATLEVGNVINALKPDVLLGADATVNRLMDAVAKNTYDLLWFAGHGDEDGIYLADGVLTAGVLTQFLRGTRPSVFINTCHSIVVAAQLYAELGAHLISTIKEIDDKVAYQTGTIFARHLAAGKTMIEAYKLSKPTTGQFVYFNGSMNVSRQRVRDATYLAVQRLDARLSDLEAELVRSQNKFCELIKTDREAVEELLRKERKRSDGRYLFRFNKADVFQLSIAMTLFSMAILLTISDIRHQIGFFNGFAAAGLIIIFLFLAAYFFASGLGILGG